VFHTRSLSYFQGKLRKVSNKSNHVGDVGIGVVKEFRNHGIGETLLAQARSWALQQGYEKLTLDLYATNELAIRFFQKFDFKRVGVLERHAKIQGSYVDAILMECQLKNQL
jgi:RimJ/RimL family protein N-acetyltransferase